MPDGGTIIDERYRVVSRIGSGGMAEVYLAEDLQLGRQVALKILQRRFAEDQEFVERFRREASSAAALSHPNVVSVFDRGEWDGTYYIAMEYLPGESLKTIVRRHGAIDPATAIDYVVQILRAARFAHQRGVIHRDLKPHNVIVDEEGRVRVTDFGIARAGASDMTQTGSIMGTAQYLSPEQAQGHAVSAASDLYAIGIVLYELLTGSLPFDGETAVTIALKQVSEAPMPPSAVNPTVPPELDAVVLCALAKDPAHRFADADAFIAALQDARTHLQPDVGATAQFAVLEAPAAAMAVAAAGAPAGPPTEPPAALAVPPLTEPEEEPEDEESDRRRWWWIAGAVLILAATAVALAFVLRTSQVTVPNLARCEPQGVALAQLRQSGLIGRPQTIVTSVCTAGRVVGQVPSGGATVDKGSVVLVRVSAGPGVTAVPKVAGQTRDAALHTLTVAGFRPTAQSTASSTIPVGHVIATIPRAGTQLAPGSQVSVLVSSGPQTVPVPDVTGEVESTAVVNLTNAGLIGGTVTQQPSSQPSGTVLSQNPAGGSLVPKGSTVDLTVAKPQQQQTLVNVVGESAGTAGAKLGAAGYNVTIVNQTVSNPSQVGKVIHQSPSAGQTVNHGSTVTITVGQPSTTTSTTATGATGPTGPGTTTTSTPGPGAAAGPAPPAASVAP
jgi:serine/threonine-protein kinase